MNQDTPWLKNVEAWYNNDGSLHVRGEAGPENAAISLYVPDENQWKGVAGVKEGRFLNLSIYPDYIKELPEATIRVETGDTVSEPVTVKIGAVLVRGLLEQQGGNRYRISGKVIPVGTHIFADKNDNTGLQWVEDVDQYGNFSRTGLSSDYLYEFGTMRLFIRNGPPDAGQMSGPFDVRIWNK